MEKTHPDTFSFEKSEKNDNESNLGTNISMNMEDSGELIDHNLYTPSSHSVQIAKYMVGIGASAGGLDALETFFRHMPPNTGASFAVIQHLSPDFKSLMDEILGRRSVMPVVKVENGMLVEANKIFLIPPKKNMIIAGNRFILTDQEGGHTLNLPIDIFFRSIAQEYRKNCMGVILSGSGSDGSRGINSIHASGGLVIVQDLESAKFDGMPKAAINTHLADFIVKPEVMARVIFDYIHSNTKTINDKQYLVPEGGNEGAMVQVFDLLKLKYSIDFKNYRSSTVDRRLERRMALVKAKDMEEYVSRLIESSDELNNLYQDLLIGVTQFYRDRPAFDILENDVMPRLFIDSEKRLPQSLRIWVPGCATGEEAYSIAIMCANYARKHDMQNIDIKIFATDVHRESLEVAAAGIYPRERLEDVDQELVDLYFEELGNGAYRIDRNVRKLVIFAPQNVIEDPPFTKVDLISCRNFLIYLEPSTQHKVISLFHFSLTQRGVLFLGPSETLGVLGDEFEPVSSKWKIYLKRRDIKLPNISLNLSGRTATLDKLAIPAKVDNIGINKSTIPENYILSAYEALLNDFVDSGILLNEYHEIIHIFGSATRFLRVSAGRLERNTIKLVDPRLTSAINASAQRALSEKVAVKLKDLRITNANQEEELVTLIIKSVENKRSRHRLVFCGFLDFKRDVEVVEFDRGDVASQARIIDLESELEFTKESLENANEELEASNEQLQASNEELVVSNEELQSTNEELQSTNEELQSTNEELQSVNEELHSVNTEYQAKIEELTQLTSDFESLLKISDIASIFVDDQLRIRKFTESASSYFKILSRDVGRSIEDLVTVLPVDPALIIKICRRVLETGIPEEMEIYQEFVDQWLIFKCIPYSLQELSMRRVNLILSFASITDNKRNYRERMLNEYRFSLIARLAAIQFKEKVHEYEVVRLQSRVAKVLENAQSVIDTFGIATKVALLPELSGYNSSHIDSILECIVAISLLSFKKYSKGNLEITADKVGGRYVIYFTFNSSVDDAKLSVIPKENLRYNFAKEKLTSLLYSYCCHLALESNVKVKFNKNNISGGMGENYTVSMEFSVVEP